MFFKQWYSISGYTVTETKLIKDAMFLMKNNMSYDEAILTTYRNHRKETLARLPKDYFHDRLELIFLRRFLKEHGR